MCIDRWRIDFPFVWSDHGNHWRQTLVYRALSLPSTMFWPCTHEAGEPRHLCHQTFHDIDKALFIRKMNDVKLYLSVWQEGHIVLPLKIYLWIPSTSHYIYIIIWKLNHDYWKLLYQERRPVVKDLSSSGVEWVGLQKAFFVWECKKGCARERQSPGQLGRQQEERRN